MKRVILSILAFAVTGACYAEEQKINLTFCTDKSIANMSGVEYSSDDNQVIVCGKTFDIQGKTLGVNTILSIDTDGNGKFTSAETIRFKRGAFKPCIVKFKVTLNGKEQMVPMAITWADVYKDKPSMGYRPAWGMSGKVDGQTIYFINHPKAEDFSFRNTRYAVKSAYLIPVRPNIFINGKFYSVSLKDDGTEVTLKEVDQSGFGKFSFKSNMKACKCLILGNGEWAFDLMDPTLKAVPEGEFEIKDSIYGTPSAMLRLEKSKENPCMTFKNDNENIITIGAPFTYYVKATLNGDNVQVEPTQTVMGSGGEIYWFSGQTGKVPPSVLIFVGRKCASKGRMEFG